MKVGPTLAHTLQCGMLLLLLAGCASDYADLQPGDVRVFRIPTGDPASGPDSMLCLLSVPVGYTPDHSFPLLVTLHGGGSNAYAFHDLWRPVTQAKGWLLATPQGGERGLEGVGYRWGPNAQESIGRSMDVILRTAHVDPSAVYLAGFSQGGRVAYALARSHPAVFAGLVAIGVGYDLPGGTGLEAFRNLRVYIGHGELEPGLEAVRHLADSLRAEGCEVELAVYQDTGHGMPQPVSPELEGILEFLKRDD